MVRNKYLTFLGAGLLFMASACNDEYEKEPVEQFTLDYLFSKVDSAGVQSRRFIKDIYSEHLYDGYNRIGGDYVVQERDFLDAASDDAVSIDNSDPDVYRLLVGRYSALTRIATDMRWGEYYRGIRKANILINNIDAVPFNIKYTNALGEVKPLNYTMKAEARFLRAHFYFELVKRYGGVTLVNDDVYDLTDNMELPRNTFAQCIDYIVRELDEIKNDLRSLPIPDASDFAYTPTKEACMAMKARVLLYAASPLFNERPIEPGNELIGYASYDPERWNLAAQAAKDLIDEFGPNGKNTLGLAANYRNTFITEYNPSNNPEMIFCRPSGRGTGVELANGPLGFSGTSTGYGRTNPTQNLVESFPMKDGKVPGTSEKYIYNPVNDPYKDRDPRLEFTVLHHGSFWLGTPLETNLGGANNPAGAAYSRTCYYMCKFMKEDYTKIETSTYSATLYLWVMYRYGEVLLNYAEALNEYQPDEQPSQEIYDAIIALRKRAGIEEGDDKLYGLKASMTKEEMRAIIQNERRIEMAFEEQRYWDIRRWRIAEEIFKKPLRGLNIQISGSVTNYYEIDVMSTTFDVKRYFYPIPYSEVIKNKNMVQNPNW